MGFGRDWSVGLGAMLGNGHTENLKKILVSGIFPEQIDVFAFRMYNKSTKYYQNR